MFTCQRVTAWQFSRSITWADLIWRVYQGVNGRTRRHKNLLEALAIKATRIYRYNPLDRNIYRTTNLVHRTMRFTPCKRIRNPESSKFLLLESGIQGTGIRNPQWFGTTMETLWNPLWNGFRNPESWNRESRGRDPESRMRWTTVHYVKVIQQ